MQTLPFTHDDLFVFIDRAGKATFAGDGKPAETLERKGFTELEFSDGYFYYRDSYTGATKSRGMELVRYKGETVWASMYGGGMVEGKEDLEETTFEFLKKAMLADEPEFKSFRGPHKLSDGDWEYTDKQEGDISEFSGYEKIKYKGELVFFHRIIGGIINHA